MIVLNVTYQCKPELREEFLEAIMTEGIDAASRAEAVEAIMTEGIDAASRAEAGNIKYDYYTPVDNGDELLLVEKWRDADALKAHSAQPHFARLGEIKAEFVLDTVIERFEA